MPRSGLTALQERVLEVLAGFDPSWTLTGGAALVAIHGVRRTTRDLDLFFHGQESLGHAPDEAMRRLRGAGLDVAGLQSAAAFRRLRVSDGKETVVLDLVADPVPVVEAPQTLDWHGRSIQVDTPHEILVNKLCSLLHRSELRDLADVRDLLAAGGDLARALADAPRKDGGFSPMTLAWLLRGLAVRELGELAGASAEWIVGLETFRNGLVAQVARLSKPD